MNFYINHLRYYSYLDFGISLSDELTKINPLIDLPKLSYFAVFPDSFSETSASEQVKSSKINSSIEIRKFCLL